MEGCAVKSAREGAEYLRRMRRQRNCERCKGTGMLGTLDVVDAMLGNPPRDCVCQEEQKEEGK